MSNNNVNPVVLDQIDLDGIRARLAAATPGAWTAITDWGSDRNQSMVCEARNGGWVAHTGQNVDEAPAANAEFIAHARTDVEDLLADLAVHDNVYVDVCEERDMAQAYIEDLKAELAGAQVKYDRMTDEITLLRDYVEEARGIIGVLGIALTAEPGDHTLEHKSEFVAQGIDWLTDVRRGDPVGTATARIDKKVADQEHPLAVTSADPTGIDGWVRSRAENAGGINVTGRHNHDTGGGA